MCIGNAIAATQKQLAAASPPFAQAMAAPAEAQPSFDFRGFSPLDLRVTSEQGRENLDRLLNQKPVAAGISPPGSAAQKAYESQLTAWQGKVSTQEKQLAAIQEEEYRRGEPARIAAERMNLIASQQAAMATLRRQAAEQQESQKATVADLQRQRDEGISKIKTESAAQQAQIKQQADKESKQIGINSSAVASSLRMLAMNGGQQGPTAAVAPRKNVQPSGGRSTTASLRMGATGRGSGSGANLSV